MRRDDGGAVLCWGYNGYGELGDGTTTDRVTPTPVVGLSSGVAAVAAGWLHACAVTTGGAVLCSGDNLGGELGDGTTTGRVTPTAVVGLSSGVAAVVAGGYHTCAVTTGGGVKCWGHNRLGQLGDGTTTDRVTPVRTRGFGQIDFDGDDVAEPAVYRPSTGEWWALLSTKNYIWQNGYLHASWGMAGDVPVPGDYDGDGQIDFGVYRPSTGEWWVTLSSNGYNWQAGYLHASWGASGDTPVPGDYDGDGKTDLAVFRPSTGEWWITLSSHNYDWQAGYLYTSWGMAGDVPVPGDYDGDGKTDLAVFRPSTDDWWGVYSSHNYNWQPGFLHVMWGAVGDVAVLR